MHSPPVQPISGQPVRESAPWRRCRWRRPPAGGAARGRRPPRRWWRSPAARPPRSPRAGAHTYRRRRSRVNPRHPGVLVDPHAELEADAAQPADQQSRMDGRSRSARARPPDAGASRRGRCPTSASESSMNIPGAAAARAPRPSSSQAPSWDGVRAVHSQPPLVKLGVDAVPPGRTRRSRRSRRPTGGRPRSRRSSPAASRARGTSPTRRARTRRCGRRRRRRRCRCSSTTTSQPGSHCFSRYAVHSPTKPPPTMHTSAEVRPVSGGASGSSPSASWSHSDRCFSSTSRRAGRVDDCESAVCVIGPPWYRAAVCRGLSSRPQRV